MAGGETRLQDRKDAAQGSFPHISHPFSSHQSRVVSSSFRLFPCRRKHLSFSTSLNFPVTLYFSPFSQLLSSQNGGELAAANSQHLREKPLWEARRTLTINFQIRFQQIQILASSFSTTSSPLLLLSPRFAKFSARKMLGIISNVSPHRGSKQS